MNQQPTPQPPPVNDAVVTLMQGGSAVLRIENETQQMMTLQRPRDIDKVIAAALHELELAPVFALSVFYSIPYKDRSDGDERTVNVEGTGTHGAAMLARLWGNNAHGVRITGDDDRRVYLEGVFMDYETNTRTMRPFVVNKFAYRHATKSEIPLSARDLAIAIQAGVSKADRNAIMASLPPALKVAFFNKARVIAMTLATPENINTMLATCEKHKVARGKVMQFIGAKSVDHIKGAEFVRLASLANALSEGEITAAEISGEKRERSSKSAVTGLVNQQTAQPAAPPPAPAPGDSPEFTALKQELQGGTFATAGDLVVWGNKVASRMAKLSNDELVRMRNMYTALRESLPAPTAAAGKPGRKPKGGA